MLPGADDTIVALATPPGRGAIAMVRLSGPRALDVAGRVLPSWDGEDRRPSKVDVRDPDSGDLIDRGIATFYQGPRSYTGEHVVELTVHGGPLVATLTLAALIRAGARQALAGEFTRRAVLAGKMDLLQAEGVGDLIDATSHGMHSVALRQVEGGLSREIASLRDAILSLEALIAYDIDFPEEDDGPVEQQRIIAATDTAVRSLDRLLARSGTGEVLREGAVVVIAGAPNVGKSSLFNTLAGSNRAIVTDIPGTTRDAIEAVIDVRGWPVRLVDTAGLRSTEDVVERLGIEVSERYLAAAEVVLAVGDSREALALVEAVSTERSRAPVIRVRSKADLHTGLDTSATAAESAIAVSTVTGTGLPALVDAIAERIEARHGSWRSEVPLLVRERHRIGVNAARSELESFRSAWLDEAIPAPVAAVHLRAAVVALEELIGSVDVDDVLDRVFRTFCVGK